MSRAGLYNPSMIFLIVFPWMQRDFLRPIRKQEWKIWIVHTGKALLRLQQEQPSVWVKAGSLKRNVGTPRGVYSSTSEYACTGIYSSCR